MVYILDVIQFGNAYPCQLFGVCVTNMPAGLAAGHTTDKMHMWLGIKQLHFIVHSSRKIALVADKASCILISQWIVLSCRGKCFGEGLLIA